MEIFPQTTRDILEPFRIRHCVYQIPISNIDCFQVNNTQSRIRSVTQYSEPKHIVIPKNPGYSFRLKRSDEVWWYNYFRKRSTDIFTIRFQNGVSTISFGIN